MNPEGRLGRNLSLRFLPSHFQSKGPLQRRPTPVHAHASNFTVTYVVYWQRGSGGSAFLPQSLWFCVCTYTLKMFRLNNNQNKSPWPAVQMAHSIRKSSGATYMGDMEASCPDPSQLRLPWQMAPPQDAACCWQGFLTVTFLSPHCHSQSLSVLSTDELPPRQRSLSHCSRLRLPSPAPTVSGLLREKEIAAARCGCHFLPHSH